MKSSDLKDLINGIAVGGVIFLIVGFVAFVSLNMEYINLVMALLVFTGTARYYYRKAFHQENGVWYVDNGYLVVCFVYIVLSLITSFIVIRKLFF